MASISPSFLCFLLQLCLGLLIAVAHGQTTYANLTDAIPQLADLYPPHTGPKHVRSLGNQNFTRCCLQAVADSYSVNQNGFVVQNKPSYTNLDFQDFNASQFPCGAQYNGNDSGAPLVTVSYTWCAQNCPGWDHSTDSDLTQWIQPFVGFILPAAVFCLNVRPSAPSPASDKAARLQACSMIVFVPLFVCVTTFVYRTIFVYRSDFCLRDDYLLPSYLQGSFSLSLPFLSSFMFLKLHTISYKTTRWSLAKFVTRVHP